MSLTACDTFAAILVRFEIPVANFLTNNSNEEEPANVNIQKETKVICT